MDLSIGSNVETGVKGQFKCKNGEMINQDLGNDLVSDCSIYADDELEYTTHGRIYSCAQPNQLPCVTGHSMCYNIGDICIYRLNLHSHLIPCRTGTHLEQCRNFECNGHFKCPQYYCILWVYICNGVWDCPFGLDEQKAIIVMTMFAQGC